jgi:acyl dehydratase
VSLGALTGRTYGPVAFPAESAVVADFVAATGDDPGRWQVHAPPALAAAALFAAAPAFLDDPEVAGHIRSLVHAEQSFAWAGALAVGEVLAVSGRVESVRGRGARHLVSFEVVAAGPSGTWMEGRSSFLLSAEAAGDAPEEGEPGHDLRGPFDPAGQLPLPPPGAAIPALRRSVSRAGLVRYAAATGDWNPIHWDHAAARAAGLPGVVAHGLLAASWLCQAAARHRPGPHPLQWARVRFHRPLRPGVGAVITGRVATVGEEGADLELALGAEGGTGALATGTLRVTP